MAQTIKIKRSTVTAVPSTLAQGELAYSAESTSNKLFIGTPGTGDVIPVGGKYYTDITDSLVVDGKITLTGDVTGSSVYNSSTKAWEIATTIAPVGFSADTGSFNFNVPEDDVSFTGGTGISTTLTKVGTQLDVSVDLTAELSITGDSGTDSVSLTDETLNFEGGVALTSTVTDDNVKFDLDDTAVTAGSYGSSTEIPTFTVDAQGRLTAAGSENIATSLTITDDDLDTDTPPETVNTRTFDLLTGTLNFAGQTGISVSTSVNGNTLNILHDLDDTAVTPGSYGSASAIPVLTIDQQGRITGASTQNVATTLTIDDNNPGTTGTLDIDLLSETLNIWGGTGVTSTLDDANDRITLSIGQDVNTSADVQFNDVTVGGVLYSNDLTGTDVVAGNLDTAAGNTAIQAGAGTGTGAGGDIVFYVAPVSETSGNAVNAHEVAMTISDDKSVVIEGDLTVRGTTTSVNSNEVNIGDNIIVLNSDETGTPSQNGGFEIERGTSDNVALRWNETTDKWQVTVDGSSYSNLVTVANFETEITELDGGTF